MMKKQFVYAAMAFMLMTAGCAKKEEAAPSPTPAVTVSPSATTGAVATQSPATSPAPATGGGTATKAPVAVKDEDLKTITKDQVDKLDPNSTYDEFVKTVGTGGVLVNESGGKKTYEFKLADQPGVYVDVTFSPDGKISEVNQFKR